MTAPLNPTVGADSGIWGGELNALFNQTERWKRAKYQSVYDNRRTGTLDETTTSQYPNSTMGPWGGVSAYDLINGTPIATMRAVVTDPRPICYKTFRQVNTGGNQFAGTGISNPEQDTFSWQHNCTLTQKSMDAAITAAVMNESAFLHSASPISSANRITNANGYLCPNLRDNSYQIFAAASLINFARTYNFDTYFFDNMNDSVNSITGTACVEYVNDNDGEFALQQGYRAIFTRIAQAGIKCILNCGGTLNTSGTNPNIHTLENLSRGDPQVRFYNQLSRWPSIVAFCEEFWMQAGSTGVPLDDSVFTANPSTGGLAAGTPANAAFSFASYRMRSQQFAHSLGKGHFGVVYGPNAPTAPIGVDKNLRFSHGIDLLLWDGVSPGGILVFANVTGANTDTSPTYKWDVGYPIGPYKRLSTVSSGFYRDFVREDGTAVQLKVNTAFTGNVTINGTSVPPGDAIAV